MPRNLAQEWHFEHQEELEAMWLPVRGFELQNQRWLDAVLSFPVLGTFYSPYLADPVHAGVLGRADLADDAFNYRHYGPPWQQAPIQNRSSKLSRIGF